MSADTFYGSDFGALESFDPEIAGVLVSELDRIRGGLQLIASENMSSPQVLTALGSTLSNKYAEGYPGRRYYGGCSEVDKAEIRPQELPLRALAAVDQQPLAAPAHERRRRPAPSGRHRAGGAEEDDIEIHAASLGVPAAARAGRALDRGRSSPRGGRSAP